MSKDEDIKDLLFFALCDVDYFIAFALFKFVASYCTNIKIIIIFLSFLLKRISICFFRHIKKLKKCQFYLLEMNFLCEAPQVINWLSWHMIKIDAMSYCVDHCKWNQY